MARLAKLGTDTPELLRSVTRIGSNLDSDLVCTGKYASRDHARITWNGRYWELRDLNSRNGTWLNGQRVAREADLALEAGQVFTFGAPQGDGWLVVDVDPPIALARSATRVALGTTDFLAVPDENGSGLIVRRETNEPWILQGVSGEEIVRDGAALEIDGERWVLTLPEESAGTSPATSPLMALLEDCTLHFVCEGGTEVSLVVLLGDRRWSFKPQRHWETLMEFAQRRLDERAKGFPEEDCGWMSTQEMADWLALTPNVVLLHVFHCRRCLREAGIDDASEVVRRRTVGKVMRIGTANLVIERR